MCGLNTSLSCPATSGPNPRPTNVCTSSSNDVATARERSVASVCDTANDGPKNIDASEIMMKNDGMTRFRSFERYAKNWNGTITSVAMPGTHMYQRRSPVRAASLSESSPPSSVPAAPTPAKNASHEPAWPDDMPCARMKNTALSWLPAYHTTEWSPAARHMCRNEA